MVESTCILHTSSHPDKYNNSVDRIISKEKEREDPRRELQSSFQLKSKSVSSNSTRNTRTSVSTCNQACFQSSRAILHTELILPQEILQLQGSSHADQYKASSSDCSPCIQAFYTAESSYKALQDSKHSRPTWHRPTRHRQASSNSTRQKQCSRWQPTSTQSLQQLPRKLHPLGITEFYQ